MELGRVGVWLGTIAALPAADERAAARELEASGYAALWFGESPATREALTHAALLLAGTERIVVATGIASIWARAPAAAANGAAALGEAYPARLVLGLGVSHAPLVAALGRQYARPLSTMRAYLAAMDAAEYNAPPPPQPVPRVLAALAPKMLELARDRAQGAHPYLVTTRHTAMARGVLGTGRLLAPEQGFVLETDPERARTVARKHLEPYLHFENYCDNWLRDGFTEDDFARGGSDRLVDEIVAWGDEAAVHKRIEEQFDAGADHVVLQALGSDPMEQLRRIARHLDL